MHHLLILEDDPLLATSLVDLFTSTGYQVEWARSLHETWFYLDRSPYDVLLIDRGIEDGDGLEVVRHVHHHAYQTKMMILSHQGQVEQRVAGLQAGADEYLAKPFSFTELLLRVEKLLHSAKLYKKQEIQLNSLTFYPEQGYLYRDGNYCVLRKREAHVLHCLTLHRGQVLTRSQIASWVWQNHETLPTDKSVDTYIKRVRKTLGSEKELIETVRGFGYRLRF